MLDPDPIEKAVGDAHTRPGPKVLAIGPLPEKLVTGAAIAFESLVLGLQQQSIPHHVIDSSAGISAQSSGTLSVRRARGVISIIVQCIRSIGSVSTLYVVIGSSRLGFLRDAIVISVGSLYRRKIILHLHGGGYKDFYEQNGFWWKKAIGIVLSRADVIIVLGGLFHHEFRLLLPGEKPNIVVVPNGLPQDLAPRTGPKSLPRSGVVRILYLSNMIASKGYMELLKACQVLKDGAAARPFSCDFAGEFLCVGSGTDAIDPKEAGQEFRRRIDDWGLAGMVRYHGPVRGEAKQSLLSAAHILILPTRYPGEGQPVCIIEALSQGTPVVSTRYRGIPEMIDDRGNGILIDEPTPDAIADAVREIVSGGEGYRRMSINALKAYQAKFSRDQYINRLIATILSP